MRSPSETVLTRKYQCAGPHCTAERCDGCIGEHVLDREKVKWFSLERSSTMTEEHRFYVKEPDGTLRPVDVPEHIARKVATYQALLAMGLDHGQIDFILSKPLD